MADHRKNGCVEGAEEIALVSSVFGEGVVPGRIMLVPWGPIKSTRGDFVVDEESARLVSEAFVAHRTDVPIDYEHQTLGGEFAAPDGQAPAAAWIKAIDAEPGVGLFARIEWTARARERLLAREYRYLSPVGLVRKSDRKLVAIHSAALTNKPAIAGMEAIVNKSAVGDETETSKALRVLADQLEVADGAGVVEVLRASSRRLLELETVEQQAGAKRRVVAAMRMGRLLESQRGWAEALVLKDPACFEEWLRTAPVVVAIGKEPAGQVNGCGAGDGVTGVEARARQEYRASGFVRSLTSEEAYVKDAVRESALVVA